MINQMSFTWAFDAPVHDDHPLELLVCADARAPQLLGEDHLRRILQAYARYYNDLRTHRSLDKDAPFSRPVQRTGSITSHALLGGLHHQYVRV